MSEYDDRTPLWNYRDNKVPDRILSYRDQSSAREYESAKAHDNHNDRYHQGDNYRRSNRYADRYSQTAGRRDYGDARRGYDGEYFDHSPGGDGGYSNGDDSYYRQRQSIGLNNRGADYSGSYDNRGSSQLRLQSAWPSEFGYPPSPSTYSRDYTERSRSRDGRQERGFFERAGDEFLSWFGDRDATLRREQDHRGRGPKAYVRSDERIREDVNDRLTDDSWIDASNIDVTVSEGEVTLTGTVDNRTSKRRAEDVVDGITGVKHVQNNLRYSSGIAATSE